MYARIYNLRTTIPFLKTYLLSGRLHTEWEESPYDSYRFNFADGESLHDDDVWVFARWAQKLAADGLRDVLVQDIYDRDVREVAFYAVYDDHITKWRLTKNLNEGREPYPDRYYVSDYTETILQENTAPPHIPDPTPRLLAALDAFGLKVRDVRFRSDFYQHTYFKNEFREIKDCLAQTVLTPAYEGDFLRFNALKPQNLHNAAMKIWHFCGNLNGKNENLPEEFFEKYADVREELELHGKRALLYALNHYEPPSNLVAPPPKKEPAPSLWEELKRIFRKN